MHVNDCFHCPVTHGCAVTKQNVQNTSAFADVTHLTITEFDQACTSPNTKLWLMYMDMVMIMKRYIHDERAGMWEEHLAEVENMLLYLVAAGHRNYISCPPQYLEAMTCLPTPALNIMKAFKVDRSLYVKQKLSSIVSGDT